MFIFHNFQHLSIENRNSIIVMEIRTTSLLLILALATLAVGAEWFEQGHLAPLTHENFDSSILEQGRYKFVKFYTQSCRYCRMLKQVEEQLREEKEWGFRFYDVDCTVHYDFCQSKVSISAFPYVGVYNLKGELEGHIGGYYPIDIMREAFKNIEQKQVDALAALKPTKTVTKVEAVSHPTPSPPSLPTVATPSLPTAKETPQIAEKMPQKPIEVNQNGQTHESVPSATKETKKGDWDSEISDGIKMCIVLFGIWMYGKTVKPYLIQSESSYPKSRIIEIPIGRKKEDGEYGKSAEKSPLMNDVL